jgi:hypothetical protein
VLVAVSHKGDTLWAASAALKNDKEVVLAAVRQNGSALQYASFDLRKDKDVVLEAIRQDGLALTHALGNFSKDKEVLLEAVRQNVLAIQFASADILNDKEFMVDVIQEAIFGSLLRCQSGLTGSSIKIEDLHRLKENYEWVKRNFSEKESNILNGTQAIQYIKKLNGKSRTTLMQMMQKSSIGEATQEAIVEHLSLESKCLKAFQLDKVEALRMISLLAKQIVNCHDGYIEGFLLNNLAGPKMPFNTFLDRIFLLSKGKKECILPAICISNYQVDLVDQDKLKDSLEKISTALVNLKGKLSTDSQSLLRPILKLEMQLFITSLTDIQKATILEKCFGNGKDSKEIKGRVPMLEVICEQQPERLIEIEDFSSANLRNIVTRKLVEVGLLESTEEAKEKFAATFLESRMPSAIFTYAAKFIGSEMQPFVKMFIDSVISGRFNEERNTANSHAKYLTAAQKEAWESGAIQELGAIGAGEVVFDPREFLQMKLVTDGHGGPLLANVVSELTGAAAASSRENTPVEDLCLKLIVAEGRDEQLRLLRDINEALQKPEFEGIEFKNDVASQIALMTANPRRSGGLKIVDSDDWQDLFFCGTEVAGSCQRVDGEPSLNKCLMGYVLDGKVRILKIAGPDGTIIARSIFKIVLDKRNSPALFFERVYPGSHAEQGVALKEFAKARASAIGLPLYEDGGGEELHSAGNAAPYEYEDAGVGVTGGSYTILAEKVE